MAITLQDRDVTPRVEARWHSNSELLARYRALRREMNRAAAEAAVLLGEIDRRRAFEEEGSLSATAWVIAAASDPAGVARSRVRSARNLPHMPSVSEAFAAGEIGEHQVRSLVEARTTEPAAFTRDEELLAEAARDLSYRDLITAVAYWRQAADPDGYQTETDRQHQRRPVTPSSSPSTPSPARPPRRVTDGPLCNDAPTPS